MSINTKIDQTIAPAGILLLSIPCIQRWHLNNRFLQQYTSIQVYILHVCLTCTCTHTVKLKIHSQNHTEKERDKDLHHGLSENRVILDPSRSSSIKSSSSSASLMRWRLHKSTEVLSCFYNKLLTLPWVSFRRMPSPLFSGAEDRWLCFEWTLGRLWTGWAHKVAKYFSLFQQIWKPFRSILCLKNKKWTLFCRPLQWR